MVSMTDTATRFTRMDESTAEQWAVIGAETLEHQPRVADMVLEMLRRLEGITDGFATDQLTHACQTACAWVVPTGRSQTRDDFLQTSSTSACASTASRSTVTRRACHRSRSWCGP